MSYSPNMKQFSTKLIERLAKDKGVFSISFVYDKKYDENQILRNVLFKDREQIRWDRVSKCRLDWESPKWHNIDGDGRKVPGFRIRPE